MMSLGQGLELLIETDSWNYLKLMIYIHFQSYLTKICHRIIYLRAF